MLKQNILNFTNAILSVDETDFNCGISELVCFTYRMIKLIQSDYSYLHNKTKRISISILF